jgi:ribose transport system ATP-binding protein
VGQLDDMPDDAPGYAVRTWGVGKTFGNNVALSDLDLILRSGSIHCLVGQNGSGKSTAIRLLSGYHRGDPGGRIGFWRDGHWLEKAINDWSFEDSRRIGLRVVHQDRGIFLDMTVLKNVCLGAGFLSKGGASRIRWSDERARAQELLARFDIDVSLDARMARLSGSDRTMVAIARALHDVEDLDRAILVLDEPTTALAQNEVKRLHQALRRYRERGVSVLYVTHSLDEVLELGDDVTVLRDAQQVVSSPISEVSANSLVRSMIGHDLNGEHPKELRDENALESDDESGVLVRASGIVGQTLSGVDLQVFRGEILGLAGLADAGQSEFLRIVAGLSPFGSGTLAVGGVDATSLDRSALATGEISYVPPDRSTEAIFEGHTTGQALTLPAAREYRSWSRYDHGRARRDVVRLLDEFAVVPPEPSVVVSTLSGGNQQKVVLAMRLRQNPQVALMDEPTQGVDIGAREEIYTIIEHVRAQGRTVIVASSDHEELARISDRILVFEGGSIVAELTQPGITSQQISIQLLGDAAREST